jgi:hypothetical protein
VFGFECISNNAPADCAILEAQIQMEVTAGAPGQVDFRFTNIGPGAASLTSVYFSDLVAPLLGLPLMITSSPGVVFSAGCSPGDLPGGTPYGFTTSYCAQSTSPVSPNGVNPGEWLNFAFTLQSGASVEDVLDAIYRGDYRVGVKLQGFDSEGSESGIVLNGVPEPSALLSIGTGLLLLPLLRRRRSGR